MAGSSIFGFVSLFLTLGACVMIWLIVLAGTTNNAPLNQIFFLWADTSDIPGAGQITEWTLWNTCNSTSMTGPGNTINCTKVHAATPFLPQQNFDTAEGVPSFFLSHPKTFYYLSRFSFSFYLISLFFMMASLVTGLLSLCSRLGSAISALAAGWALFCMAFTAGVMTAVFVLGRNAFRDAGLGAGIGVMAFAFTWASVGCLLVSTALYCIGFTASRKHNHRTSAYETKGHTTTRGRFPIFGRRRHSPAGESDRALA